MRGGYNQQLHEIYFEKFCQYINAGHDIKESAKYAGISLATAYKYEKERLGFIKYGEPIKRFPVLAIYKNRISNVLENKERRMKKNLSNIEKAVDALVDIKNDIESLKSALNENYVARLEEVFQTSVHNISEKVNSLIKKQENNIVNIESKMIH